MPAARLDAVVLAHFLRRSQDREAGALAVMDIGAEVSLDEMEGDRVHQRLGDGRGHAEEGGDAGALLAADVARGADQVVAGLVRAGILLRLVPRLLPVRNGPSSAKEGGHKAG